MMRKYSNRPLDIIKWTRDDLVHDTEIGNKNLRLFRRYLDLAVCESCQNLVDNTWAFCRFCGNQIVNKIRFSDLLASDVYTSSSILTSEEEPSNDAVVLVVDLQDKQHLLNQHLDIDSHQVALIRGKETAWTQLTHGLHYLKEVQIDQIERLVFVDRAPRYIEYTVENLLSKDPLPITLVCQMELKISDPVTMANYLEIEPQILTVHDIKHLMLSEIESFAIDFFDNEVISGSSDDSKLAKEFETQLTRVIAPVSNGYGLTISQELSVEIYREIWIEDSDNSVLDKVSSTREISAAVVSESPSISGSSLLALTEETIIAYPVRRRASILNILRVKVISRQYSLSDGRARLVDLIESIDSEQIISADLIDEIFGSVQGFIGDTDKANALLLKRLELEIEHERIRISLIHQYGLSDERLALEDRKCGIEVQSIWEIERDKILLSIDHRREILRSGNKQELEQQTPIPPVVNTNIVDLGLEWYARYKEIKREDYASLANSDLDIQHKKAMLDIEREAALLSIKLREKEEEHKRKLAEIEALSKAGIETLIAFAGPEQGELLLQLAKTRSLRGYTPEQILALQGTDSLKMEGAVREIGMALAVNGKESEFLNFSGSPDNQSVATLSRSIAESIDTVRNNHLVAGGIKRHANGATNLLPPASSSHETMTILFSDIKGSTEITDRLGDIAAQELFREHNNIVREQVTVFHGYEIKSMGDGFMLAFPSALNGILCAITIQKMLREYNQSIERESILVRMGLHAGEVIRENQDYFGRNVILASRISSHARENQILVSSILKEMTTSFNELEFETPLEITLKGLPGNTLVYPINW